MELRALGRSDLLVSRLSLGSWRTFERISRSAGAAVLMAAREAGITFLDDARYNDESGRAPLATGWSEVLFGELFRSIGWPRDEVVVANKLWWEFWPSESAAAELDGSLRRMGFDFIDLAYSAPLPEDLPVEDAVAAIAALPSTPTASPGSGQLSAPNPGSGSPSTPVAAPGRLSGQLSDPRLASAFAAARDLAALAAAHATTPAALALAFALAHPRVASVLFGATTPTQVRANAEAVSLAARLDPDTWTALRAIGAEA